MGRTLSYRKNGVLGYKDDAFSPTIDRGMWADCPRLAMLQDPSIAHVYSNHFHDYNATDWAITTVEDGAGDATEALTDALGGVLLITNDAGAVDEDEFQKVGENFQLVAGKPLWIEFGLQTSDGMQSQLLAGLCITDTTLIADVSDGIFFQKDDGDRNIDYHAIKDSSETGSTGDTGVDLANATDIRLGMKLLADGATVEYWLNGLRRATARTNIPDDELLRISLALMNGEAVAKTLSWDYVEAVQILGRY